jgi:hypothetical protein
MKTMTVLCLLLTSTFSTPALACRAGTTEANVSGTVDGLSYSGPEAGNLEHYTYQIIIAQFQPNPGCPMTKEQAEQAYLLENGDPTIRNGDPVSGTLTFDSKLNSYFFR